MNEKRKKRILRRKRRKQILALTVVLAILAVLCISWGIYVNTYSHATEEVSQYLVSTEDVTVGKMKKNSIVFSPTGEVKAGLIFYPGGKVEYTAYAPLLQELAERGVLSVVVHMPMNLAIFNESAAKGIQKEFPDVEEWYMGGHSLGGLVASNYVKKHATDFSGIIFLASYPMADLSNTDLKALSLYGSSDQVLNLKSYEKAKSKMPAAFSEITMEGGCHSYFGSYGLQRGDGTPLISEEAQRNRAVEEICKFMMVSENEETPVDVPEETEEETEVETESETESETETEEETEIESETEPVVESETEDVKPLTVDELIATTVLIGDSRTSCLSNQEDDRRHFGILPINMIYATPGGQLDDENAFKNATNAGLRNAKKAVFWFGINDVQLNEHREDEKLFISNYCKVIDTYTSTGADSEIYLVSILTTLPGEKDHYPEQEANIEKYNEALKVLCAEKGYTYLDVEELYTGREDEMFVTPEGEVDLIHFGLSWYTDKYLPFLKNELAK